MSLHLITTQYTHQHTGHANILSNSNFLGVFLHHTIVNTYVLHFAHDKTDVPCEHPENSHIDGNM